MHAVGLIDDWLARSGKWKRGSQMAKQRKGWIAIVDPIGRVGQRTEGLTKSFSHKDMRIQGSVNGLVKGSKPGSDAQTTLKSCSSNAIWGII